MRGLFEIERTLCQRIGQSLIYQVPHAIGIEVCRCWPAELAWVPRCERVWDGDEARCLTVQMGD